MVASGSSSSSRSEERTPHSEPARALFFTQAKPCDEALADLSDAYNKLADEVERLWELEEQLDTQQHVNELLDSGNIALAKRNAELVEQYETQRDVTQKWYDEAHEQQRRANRAEAERDQYMARVSLLEEFWVSTDEHDADEVVPE